MTLLSSVYNGIVNEGKEIRHSSSSLSEYVANPNGTYPWVRNSKSIGIASICPSGAAQIVTILAVQFVLLIDGYFVWRGAVEEVCEYLGLDKEQIKTVI